MLRYNYFLLLQILIFSFCSSPDSSKKVELNIIETKRITYIDLEDMLDKDYSFVKDYLSLKGYKPNRMSGNICDFEPISKSNHFVQVELFIENNRIIIANYKSRNPKEKNEKYDDQNVWTINDCFKLQKELTESKYIYTENPYIKNPSHEFKVGLEHGNFWGGTYKKDYLTHGRKTKTYYVSFDFSDGMFKIDCWISKH